MSTKLLTFAFVAALLAPTEVYAMDRTAKGDSPMQSDVKRSLAIESNAQNALALPKLPEQALTAENRAAASDLDGARLAMAPPQGITRNQRRRAANRALRRGVVTPYRYYYRYPTYYPREYTPYSTGYGYYPPYYYSPYPGAISTYAYPYGPIHYYPSFLGIYGGR